jgi:hypothetical protein
MNRQPFDWSARQRWSWVVLAILLGAWLGRPFLDSVRPQSMGINDFFQEWSSARNWAVGAPLYGSQEEALHRHLAGRGVNNNDSHSRRDFNEVNAHPPTSILLALPLAHLNYLDARFVWNIVSLAFLALSLWLVVRHLPVAWSPWSVCPLVALLLICSPFQQQIAQGQLNLVLLALITGAWAAARSGHPRSAGGLIGAAAAIKLFPAFLFAYFAVRRQWRAVVTGLVVLALLSTVTVTVLGPDSYRDYVQQSMPALQKHWNSWPNASILGFWSKLFGVNNPRSRVEPLWSNPSLALGGAAACCAVVGALLWWALRRARTVVELDLAFGLTVIAMLLVSPLTWDHYFLLLLVPLAVLWRELPRSGLARNAFRAILVLLWVPPLLLYKRFIPGDWLSGTATPWHSLLVLSLQFYALVGLFVLGIVVLALSGNRSTAAPNEDMQGEAIEARLRPRRLAPTDAFIRESHE